MSSRQALALTPKARAGEAATLSDAALDASEERIMYASVH